MGVERKSRSSREAARAEEGQALLEFLLTLPMLVALVVILVRVNTAIQVSIVNQQYARAQALWLTFNSPEFPSMGIRQGQLVAKKYSQMVIGVSDNAPPQKGQDGSAKYAPKAAAQNVARKKVPEGDDAEGNLRALVRIRDTVTICTQANFVDGAQGLVPLPAYGGPSPGEGARRRFCNTPMQYVSGDES